MLLKWPVVQARSGSRGMILPSTNGPLVYGPVALGVPCSCRMRAAERLRRHTAASAPDPGQPAAIINIADWRGLRPTPGHFAYTLTKAGRKQLRAEEAAWQQATGIVARFFTIQEDAP